MFLHYFLLYFVCYSSFASGSILQLKDENFANEISNHENALVLFYVPWCPHCQKFLPKFSEAAEKLKDNSRPISLAMVDCENDGKETCNKYGVEEFPTMKIFRNGKFSKEYEGPRDPPELVKYVKAQLEATSLELNTVEELEDFLSKGHVSLVGFFESDSYIKVVFFKVAEKMKHQLKFGHSTSEAVMEKQGVVDGIVLFRPAYLNNKFENNSVVYTGDAETEDIVQFIKSNYHGLVGHRRHGFTEDFTLDPSVSVFYSIDYVRNAKRTNYWRNRVLQVAIKYKDHFHFVISDKDEFKEELKVHNLYQANMTKPVVLAMNFRKRIFKLKEPFSVEAFDNFLRNILEGKLDPEVKSAPIPKNNTGNVTIVVAKNFDELIYNNKKDIFILFTGPGCDECILVEGPFEELGGLMKGEDVEVFKFDIMNNSMPQEFPLNGFPAIFFLRKDSKDDPISYDGDFYPEDFVKFIAKHATNELKGFYKDGKPKTVKTEL